MTRLCSLCGKEPEDHNPMALLGHSFVGVEDDGNQAVSKTAKLGSIPSTPATIRQFDTGATRDTNVNKLEWRRFLSLPALKRYCEYMNKHRVQADGNLREPDNWKHGFPAQVLADSLYRHCQEFALDIEQHGPSGSAQSALEDTLAAIIFNAFGYLHQLLRGDFNSETV